MKTKSSITILILFVSGFALFYIIPFLGSIYYALIDNTVNRQFVGIDNFTMLLSNPVFLRALKNTITFIILIVPLNMILSLLLAMAVNKTSSYKELITILFLLPLVIPSATTAFFWQKLFDLYGPVNKVLSSLGIENIDWFESQYAVMVIALIFLWKNIGYNMILFISGLNNISKEYYEYASIEGAGKWKEFTNITMPCLMPTSLLILILTLVNSFKVFKEIYLITGNYPHESIYMLQHYMNNQFHSLNYQKLTSASLTLTILIVLFVLLFFAIEKKVSKDLS
ncbi:carbohydrate ABC transporter permease [Maledivibacter halophilus]|uniref:Multiple sugar transport system permease protein n=1 Tax=Maledivibacter halophilus TaxID=36842 RepID=A0A1T5MAC9_9FIRM|nr:sugar ABC transporter permease [Maledivibacter halophilus]SKC85206.1 multiple sugar transport system permease protein [Maledivibacter halophilus]